MAQIIKNNGENSMAEEETDDRAEDVRERNEKAEARDERPTFVEPAREGSGFFHVYKSGQGYWTRIGTVAGAALIVLAVGNFFYTYLPTWSATLRDHRGWTAGIIAAIIFGLGLCFFWLMNRPSNVDFLIATDSEMKKVNWTSKRELIGSTKIVILFVLLIAGFLFLIDLLFGYFFWLINVLKQKPI